MHHLLSNGKMLANDGLQRTLQQERAPCFMVKYQHLLVGSEEIHENRTLKSKRHFLHHF
jgi:hypothetical protein